MSGLVTERYPAIVTSVEDPENRGRIRVACAGLLGDEETEFPEFVEPAFDWGWFYIPDIGESVEIEIVTSSPEDESFGQSSIDNLDITWRGTRFYTKGEDENNEARAIHPDFTATNYGKRRGFATPLGHIILFDDTEGATKIFLTWAKKVDADPATEVSQVLIDVDGTIKISVLGKHSFHIKENEIEAILGQGAALKITGKDANATTILGDGGVKAAIADHLESFYGTLKTFIEGAIVPTGMGPSGTVLAGSGSAPAWDGAINSNKLKFPDG